MDLPSQQCKTLNDLETSQPYDLLINKFRSYQDELLLLKQKGSKVQEEAANLPQLLDQRIRELRELLDKERDTYVVLKETLAEKRARDLDQIKSLDTEYSEVQGQIIIIREEKLKKARILEKNTEQYEKLLAANGLSVEQCSELKALQLQQNLPINIHNNICIPSDEVWRIIGTVLEREKQPLVPIFKLFPEIEKALVGNELLHLGN